MTRPGTSGPRTRACSLARALDYRNDDVVHKFLERFRLSPREARDLFTETKRWLWLVARHQRERAGRRPGALAQLSIDEPLILLDEMWHTFILFTREYSAYCHSRFGTYLHHAPATRSEQQRRGREFRRSPARAREDEAVRLRAQYQYVHARLGEATLRKWYSRYARRYTREFVRSVRI